MGSDTRTGSIPVCGTEETLRNQGFFCVLNGEQTEFREALWGGLVDHIRIDEKSSTVVFRGGIEITI